MMNRLTIQSIQQRFPWIMWPVTVLDVVLTPRRWGGVFEGVGARLTAALTRDTAPLARRLVSLFGWVGSLRGRLLADRPLLMRIAWRVRQLIWSITWSFIVVSRLWPRRTPVPDEDVPVRLLPAPETYRDFQSPSLMVPSDMPRAEMSLPGAMIVQALHILQDLYPGRQLHTQPEAAAGSRRAAWGAGLSLACSGWVQDAAGLACRARQRTAARAPARRARRRRTVCQAARALRGKREYQIDLDYLRQYPVSRRPGSSYGCRIRYADSDTDVAPSAAIELRRPPRSRPATRAVAVWPSASRSAHWRRTRRCGATGCSITSAAWRRSPHPATHALPPAHPLARLPRPAHRRHAFDQPITLI